MDIHKNARLTPHSRADLVRRVLERGEIPKAVATAFGISTKTVHKWVARFQAGGPDGLHDRSSRPHSLRQPTSQATQERVAGGNAAEMASPVVFQDFTAYAPLDGTPVAFMAAPVLDGGQVAGVIGFSIPVGQMNAITGDRTALGRTGETYLVGSDRRLRSAARFVEGGGVLKTAVESRAVSQALEGAAGVTRARSYRGADVITAFAPLRFAGTTWAVVSEIEAAEALAPARALLARTAGIAAILVAVFGALGLWVSRGIARPLHHITTAMGRIAGGDYATEVSAAGRRDEIGTMAQALARFREALQDRARLEAERQESERRAAAEKQAALAEMADGFEATVGEVVHAVTGATRELADSAQTMSAIAEEGERQASSVAAAAAQASSNVEAVSSASEELSASVQEIASQVARTSDVARDATDKVAATDRHVQDLAQAAERIGEVVGLIQDIAEQTNLLALNATIEAARAGEAGKGFAVVAGEVKNLAAQTQKATEQIRDQIESVQGETREAVGSIQDIGRVVNEMAGFSQSVASAIEQQQAATAEISRNAQQAAGGTRSVSDNIQGIHAAAGQTGQTSAAVLDAARRLGASGDELDRAVADFLARVRS